MPTRKPTRSFWHLILLLTAFFGGHAASAQPCLTNWTVSASTPPVNGTYACGQTVTFCLTVTGWNQSNANWFHGVVASFGPGWNMASVVPGAPPPSCSGAGTWGYYNSVQGTSFFTNIGPQGPGFFFDLNNDGNAGNNFGDNCTGSANWQFCWTISALDGPACVNGTGLSVTFNTFSDSETGSWSGAGCNGDPIVPMPPAVIGGTCTIDAGTDASLTVCSTSTPVDLWTTLGGSPDAGGVWSGPGGGVSSGTFVAGTSAAGAYTYTVTSVSPPCTESAVVTMNVVTQPNAGSNGAITACASDAPISLFDLLGNSPDAGGTWNDPTGVTHSGIFIPSGGIAGTYTYTVTGTAPCIASSATVEVEVLPTPNAGANSILTVCSTGDAVTLFDVLGGSPAAGGTWTAPDGSPSGGVHQPGSDGAGIYVYAVAGTAPCPGSSATVTIVENVQPIAAQDALATYCQSDAAVDMFPLLEGLPDAGGIWTDGTGATVPAILDPQSATSSTFTYTVTGIAPCVDATAMVTITIVPGANAGSNGSVSLCSTDAPSMLFDALGGAPDAGGAWTAPNGQPSTGVHQPGTNLPGAYSYVVLGSAPCPNSTAIVTVAETVQPSAGTDGTASLCETGGPTQLLPFIGGTPSPGGTWTAPDGITVSGTIDPQSALAGGYVYTVDAPAPCAAAQSLVEITINAQSDAGLDGSLTLCTGSDAVLLMTTLGGDPDSGGSWTGPAGVANAVFTPGVDAAGTYTYSVPSLVPCITSTATVTINVSDQPDAGEDGTVTLCIAPQLAFTLFSALEGSPAVGGIWTDPTGQPHGTGFTPGIDAPGTYTYTIEAAAPCATVSSSVDVLVVEAAEAGSGGNIILCEDDGLIDPSTWLSGSPDPGGSWAAPDGSIITTVDVGSAPSGTYIYTVPGVTPCPAAQATVTLTVDLLPFAGTDASLNVCSDAATQFLFDLLGPGAQAGGVWTGPSGTSNGSFVPGASPAGEYAYTVQGTGGCMGRTSTAFVNSGIFALPVPTFIVEPSLGCAPLAVDFTNTTSGDAQAAVWDLGDGGTSLSPTTLGYTFINSGSFTVSLTVTDANGCTATTMAPGAVLVSNGPPASFIPTPLRLNQARPVFDVVHSPSNEVDYVWTFDGTTIEGGANFAYTIEPPFVGVYPLCLVATDSLGCSNELCIDITVIDDITIHVPNAFTPDGDGINDVFAPVLISVDPNDYQFIVFDRWGAEVFSTTDPMEVWNGGYRNRGETLPTGVYVWRVTARDPFSADRRELLGSVTLLK